MTQVKEWSNQELNCALAELINYPMERIVPNYCTDPAASLEVQTAALDANHRLYIKQLGIKKMGYPHSSYNLKDIKLLLMASPRERSEAAYKTLSSQVDTPAPKEVIKDESNT